MVKNQKSLTKSYYRALKGFGNALPVLLGVVMLLGLFRMYVTEELLASVFTEDPLRDTLIGAVLGSISGGNPVTSYLIGGELLDQGITLFAVTAFIVTWVTVGIAQFPAEARILGMRFALKRNLLSFFLSIFVATATVLTLGVV